MRYVVTAPGRSGTNYTAELLTAAGLRCGHEDVFDRWGPNHRTCPDWRRDDLDGDSSYIAAPFLDDLKLHLTVVQLVRPPLDQIRSVVGLGHVGDLSRPWVRFLDAHTQLGKQPPGPRRAAVYWLRWHEMIEPHADLLWRLGEVTTDDIYELAELSDLDVDLEVAAKALEDVPPTVNSGTPADWVTLDHLGPHADAVVAMAERYEVPLQTLHTGGIINPSDAPLVVEGDCRLEPLPEE